MFNRYGLKTDNDNQKHAEWLFLFVDKTIKEIEDTISNFSDKAILDLAIALFSQLYTIAADSLDNELLEEISSKDKVLFNSLEFVTNKQKEESALIVKEKLINKGIDALNEKEPLLKEALDKRCRYFKDAIFEMVERINDDRYLITKELLDGDNFTKIEGLNIPSIDLHNHGRFPVIISTDKGKFIYKAHSMDVDLWFYNLTNNFFSDVIHVPKIVSINSKYGYSKFFENQPANTFEKVKKYYHNIGGFLAILEMLGSSDFHFENILADFEYPAPIDFETIIEIGNEIILNPKSINKAVYQDLPVIRKGILPLYLFSKKRELSPLFNKEDANVSMPVVDGKKIDVRDYIEDFKEGFKDIYLRCLDNKEEIVDELYKLNDANIRAISIGTQTYADLMLGLYNHSNFESINNRTTAINELLNKYKLDESLKNYADSAIDGLIQGDIPYHYAKANSKDIYYLNEVILKDYLSDIPINIGIKNVNALSLEDLYFELALIDKQFSYSMHNGYTYKAITLENKDYSLDTSPLKEELEKIYDSIKKSYVIDSKGNQSWLVQDDNAETKAMDESLFKGTSGLAIFFTSYIEICSNANRKAEAINYLDICLNKVLVSLEYYKNLLKDGSCSLGLTGLSGVLLSLVKVSKALNRKEDKELLLKTVELLKDVDFDLYSSVDVYGGLSGLLIVLCKNIKTFNQNYIYVIISKIANRIIRLRNLEYKGYLLWDSLGKKRPISGWGHGIMGVVEALTLAYEITNNKEYLDVAIDSYRFEHDIYSEKLKTWPDLRNLSFAYEYMHGLCSGAPGIGDALLSIDKEKAFFETYDIDFSRAEEACSNIINYRDHLCCGNSSILDFFINAYHITNNIKYINKAYNLVTQMIKRKEDINDYVLLPSDYKTNDNPTLFFGISGIGFEIAKLIKTIENI